MHTKLNLVSKYVQSRLENDHTDHNMSHIQRVVKLSRYLLAQITADALITLTAAYLHDVIDDKLTHTPQKQIEQVKLHLRHWGFSNDQIQSILKIITNMSFSANLTHHYHLPIEGQIVQDADRLDAIGAVGIARAFYYAGHKGETMYDASVPIRKHMNKRQYRIQKTTTYNHFYEKLLKLKDSMNTDPAKRLAQQRNIEMLQFLAAFKQEWNFN